MGVAFIMISSLVKYYGTISFWVCLPIVSFGLLYCMSMYTSFVLIDDGKMMIGSFGGIFSTEIDIRHAEKLVISKNERASLIKISGEKVDLPLTNFGFYAKVKIIEIFIINNIEIRVET